MKLFLVNGRAYSEAWTAAAHAHNPFASQGLADFIRNKPVGSSIILPNSITIGVVDANEQWDFDPAFGRYGKRSR